MDASAIQHALETALLYQQQRRFAEAEEICRDVLSNDADNLDALYLLGVLAHQQSRNDEAVQWLRRALVQAPEEPQLHINYAVVCHAIGKTHEALEHLRRAVKLDPASAEAHDRLGTALEQAGRFDESLAAYQRAAAESPNDPAILDHLARAASRLGRHSDALAARQTIIQLQPTNAQALINLSRALTAVGRFDDAAVHARRAIELNGELPDAYAALAGPIAAVGNFEEARALAEKALSLNPQHADALAQLAFAHAKLGRAADAVTAARAALALQPDHAGALDQLAWAHYRREEYEQAIPLWQKLLSVQPWHAHAWCNLGAALSFMCELRKSLDCYRRALEIDPPFRVARGNLLVGLQVDPQITPQKMFDEHRQFQRITLAGITPRRHERPGKLPNRKIRIGYSSPFLFEHALTAFVEPILHAHDRARFEITCYADGTVRDACSQRLQRASDHWVESAALTDDQLFDRIAADASDILVDLTGHLQGNRLPVFARRPAPVQVTYIGYQTTTALDAMDYRITDADADPPGVTDRFHTEKLIRLPCFFIYQPTAGAEDIAPPPFERSGHITFGSLNNPAKFSDPVIELWSNLLRRVTDARLLLLIDRRGVLADTMRQRFALHGVDPSRLDFIRRESHLEYLRAYHRIDVALDPFPMSGHTTTCDALWMGVPVVTLAGQMYGGRMSTSVLANLKLPELIAQSPSEYVEIAARLAEDRSRLAEWRRSLRPMMGTSPITDATGFTRQLEFAYEKIWRDWCEGS